MTKGTEKVMKIELNGEELYTVDGAIQYISTTPAPGKDRPISIGYGGFNAAVGRDRVNKIPIAVTLGKSTLFRRADLDTFIANRVVRNPVYDTDEPKLGRPGTHRKVTQHSKRRGTTKRVPRRAKVAA